MSAGPAQRAVAATVATLLWACGPGGSAVITVDATHTYQTMTGWEFTGQGGQDRPAFQLYGDTLIGLAVRDLGLNRIRLEVRSGMEHRRDYWRETLAGRLRGDEARCARYETENDNDDPRVIDPGGFHFGELDRAVEGLVIPMQRLLASRGERLVVNVTYVSFMRQCAAGHAWHHQDPDEYAEFALATALHLRDRFGIVPDYWEVILEPDNTDFWTGTRLGEAMVAAAARFQERGMAIRFVGPSNTSTLRALPDFDAMIRVPGVPARLGEFAYHRYKGVSTDMLREIGERGRRHGVRTAMLEHIGSGVDDLIEDLTVANVSAWQQFALAFRNNPKDEGSLYYRVDDSDPTHPIVRPYSRTRLLAQAFRYVRLGAVRLGAVSTGAVSTVAFRNADGRYVVVARSHGRARMTVQGLPAGRYGTTWTTRDSSGAAADTAIAANGSLVAEIPGAGVLTVFGQ